MIAGYDRWPVALISCHAILSYYGTKNLQYSIRKQDFALKSVPQNNVIQWLSEVSDPSSLLGIHNLMVLIDITELFTLANSQTHKIPWGMGSWDTSVSQGLFFFSLLDSEYPWAPGSREAPEVLLGKSCLSWCTFDVILTKEQSQPTCHDHFSSRLRESKAVGSATNVFAGTFFLHIGYCKTTVLLKSRRQV